MREIFSVRFFAAVGAVVGLFFLLTTVFATREVIDNVVDDEPTAPVVQVREIDLVEQVFASLNPSFSLTEDGLAASDTELAIDGSRSLRVVTDTPGENHCPDLGEIGACAVVADLLGEAVVWFALVPMGANRTVRLPAIDVLEGGRAKLVNGWRLPYAPVLDRRCADEAFDSYRELREVLGDDFTSIFSVAERRLIAVECRVRVPYAAESAPANVGSTTVAPSTMSTTSPAPASPGGGTTGVSTP